jgi:hypothetical protein
MKNEKKNSQQSNVPFFLFFFDPFDFKLSFGSTTLSIGLIKNINDKR